MAGAIIANAAELTPKETSIVDIGAWTARGEQGKKGTQSIFRRICVHQGCRQFRRSSQAAHVVNYLGG